jgi:hypothetical protein
MTAQIETVVDILSQKQPGTYRQIVTSREAIEIRRKLLDAGYTRSVTDSWILRNTKGNVASYCSPQNEFVITIKPERA